MCCFHWDICLICLLGEESLACTSKGSHEVTHLDNIVGTVTTQFFPIFFVHNAEASEIAVLRIFTDGLNGDPRLSGGEEVERFDILAMFYKLMVFRTCR